jgi:D-alanyl-D-alanine carboxypeptidase
MWYNKNGDDMKRKIKAKPIIILVVTLLLLIFGIIYIIKTVNYHQTYDYKLSEIGYTKEQITPLKKLDNTSLDYILTIPPIEKLSNLVNEKYFMEKNLKKYINYLDKTENLKEVISIVNVGADNKWYTNTKKADISKGHLLLTNKFHYLDNTYNSENMVKVSNKHSYGENQMLTNETYDAFIKMFNAAKKEDLTIIINSSYRSYEDQEEIYNYYKRIKGEEYADKIAARTGYSEHQTGMAIDVTTYNASSSTFEEFDVFKWLQNNAYKYGFILRYPKDKEHITGYSYESWHYRYVGIEVATYIHENNITFDEYYAYFLN